MIETKARVTDIQSITCCILPATISVGLCSQQDPAWAYKTNRTFSGSSPDFVAFQSIELKKEEKGRNRMKVYVPVLTR